MCLVSVSLSKNCIRCGVSFVKGYNISRLAFETTKFCSKSCGAKERIFSLETRKKISEANKRNGTRPPTFAELSLDTQKLVLQKRATHPPPRLGKKASLETRKKLSLSKLGARAPRWKGGITFNRNYKRMKKMEYLGRKYSAEGNHTKQDWEELKRIYNYMCLCCKQQEPFIKLTEDHIVPLSKGGSDKISNIQPLCMSCNSIKNTKIISFVNIFGARY